MAEKTVTNIKVTQTEKGVTVELEGEWAKKLAETWEKGELYCPCCCIPGKQESNKEGCC